MVQIWFIKKIGAGTSSANGVILDELVSNISTNKAPKPMPNLHFSDARDKFNTQFGRVYRLKRINAQDVDQILLILSFYKTELSLYFLY